MIRHLAVLTVLVSGLLQPLLRAADPPHVVIMIGEDEYRTAETLPAFATQELLPLGFRVSIVHADPADKNRFPGLVDALGDADLLLLSVRRRTPPANQLDAVKAHVRSGKALVGIRTASHAFALRSGDVPEDSGLATWPTFDPEILGGNYHNHHGSGPQTAVTPTPGSERHPVLHGIPSGAWASAGSLYKVRPLEPGTTPLLLGTIPDQPSEPVAWTRQLEPHGARVFYTSLGHPEDFADRRFRRLLVNAVRWALDRP